MALGNRLQATLMRSLTTKQDNRLALRCPEQYTQRMACYITAGHNQ